MMHQFYSGQAVLERVYAGPFGSYVDSFAKLLSERGYARQTVKRKIRIVARMSQWLKWQGLSVQALNEGRIAKFLRYCRKRQLCDDGDAPTLQQLLTYLRRTGVLPRPSPLLDDSEVGRIVRDYEQYLRNERRLAEVTLADHLPCVRSFLHARFGSGPVLLRDLQTNDISRFFLQKTSGLGPGRAKRYAIALRSFSRFLRLRGEVSCDLSVALFKTPNWKLAGLPKFISADKVERILQSCDRSTSVGLRDYAVLLLLARLGLRSAEVVTLGLNDINWDEGHLFVRGKGSSSGRLPLLQDVGNALAAYLKHARPRSSSRRVFVRMNAPHDALANSAAIHSLVRTAFERAGVKSAQKGPHVLRHSLATEMLRRGATLSEIGEILRHRHPTTTQIYAKVDLQSLRALAEPWIGGEA